MLIFSMAVVSPFVISFFLKDLYHCWSLQPPLFFISLYTLYTALPKRLQLDRLLEEHLDGEVAEVPWSRVATVLAINRLCAPGSELAIEERWYPMTALEDML